jgi:O-antigen/teichoic acid export membrane protein
VLALIFLGGINLWSPALLFIKQNPIYFTVFLLFVLASTVSGLTWETFIAERRAGFVLAGGLIFNLLRLPLVILLAAFFHSFGIFASLTIAVGVALLLSVFFFLPRAQPGYRPFFAVNRKVLNEMLHFSFANYLAILFWTAPGLVLPIMVVNLLGAELNAYFYIAWAIGGMLSVIPGAASISLFAEGSYEQERLGINIWRSLKMILLLLAPAVMLMLAFADKILLLFGTALFRECYHPGSYSGYLKPAFSCQYCLSSDKEGREEAESNGKPDRLCGCSYPGVNLSPSAPYGHQWRWNCLAGKPSHYRFSHYG